MFKTIVIYVLFVFYIFMFSNKLLYCRKTTLLNFNIQNSKSIVGEDNFVMDAVLPYLLFTLLTINSMFSSNYKM